jgi:hypothetical protein
MAYMSQEKKAKIAPVIKSILKKYKVKGSLSVRNHMSLVLTIKEGSVDFYNDYGTTPEARQDAEKFGIQVNPYWYQDHFVGQSKKFLAEIIPAMNSGNHNNSDVQSDYFDVGWYIDVNIGKWNKPYVATLKD